MKTDGIIASTKNSLGRDFSVMITEEIEEIPDSTYTVTGDFFVLERHRRCFRCNKVTPVIAFALKDYYRGAKTLNTKQRVLSHICLLSDVSPIPSATRDTLMRRFGYYTQLCSKTDIPVNHCIFCGATQGNYYLFDELYEPLEEGQFNGEPLDDDARFYKISYQGELALSSSGAGHSIIPEESARGRLSDTVILWGDTTPS